MDRLPVRTLLIKVVMAVLIVGNACSVYKSSLIKGEDDDSATHARAGTDDGTTTGDERTDATGRLTPTDGIDAAEGTIGDAKANTPTAGDDGVESTTEDGGIDESDGGSGTDGGGSNDGDTSGNGEEAGSGGTSDGDIGGDAGSSSTCPAPTTSGTSLVPDLIDDFEDGDDALLMGLGTPPRVGYWYAFHDDTEGGIMVPNGNVLTPTTLDPVRGDSTSGVFASAVGFTVWGAGIGVDLNNSGEKEPYDASAYDGFIFWAKGSTTGTPVELRVPIPATAPPGEGGSCTADSGCGGYHRYALGELDDEWQQITIHFCQLEQPWWALEAEFDSSQVLSILFQGTETSDIEIWVDDLSFFTVQ